MTQIVPWLQSQVMQNGFNLSPGALDQHYRSLFGTAPGQQAAQPVGGAQPPPAQQQTPQFQMPQPQPGSFFQGQQGQLAQMQQGAPPGNYGVLGQYINQMQQFPQQQQAPQQQFNPWSNGQSRLYGNW